jgi:multiple sugar transport system permease protein
MSMVKTKRSIVTSYVLLILFTAVVLLPFIWMFLSSFKSQRELFQYPPTLIPNKWMFSNYSKAWNSGTVNFGVMFFNSMKVVIPSVVFTILTSSLASYAFARIRFKGRDVIFMVFLASMMVPAVVLLIPQFLMFTGLRWIDTYLPLIVPKLFGTPFAVFLLRQFFMTISLELEEAAIIDGCKRFRIWWNMFLPLSKPIIATLSVFSFQFSYNDLLNQVIYLNSAEKYTVQLGLASFKGSYSTRYDLLMAASMFAMVPVLVIYAFSQKYIVKGIVMTGIKG